MATSTEGRTPWTDAKVLAGMIVVLAIPAILALRSVRIPQVVVPVGSNPSPLGYTRSLSLFLVPSVVLAWWLLRHPEYGIPRRAFWLTLAGLLPLGFGLDVLFAHAFFTFENRAATLGIEVPVVGGSVPVEEFVFVGVHGVEGSFLGEVDKVLLQRLKLGADIEVPAGTTGIRSMMSDLTLVSGNEVALLRMQSGRRIIRMGGPTSVPVGKFVDRVIAHTHPSGRLKFSGADLRTLRGLGQRSSVIVDPRADMGARLLVPPLGPTP